MISLHFLQYKEMDISCALDLPLGKHAFLTSYPDKRNLFMMVLGLRARTRLNAD